MLKGKTAIVARSTSGSAQIAIWWRLDMAAWRSYGFISPRSALDNYVRQEARRLPRAPGGRRLWQHRPGCSAAVAASSRHSPGSDHDCHGRAARTRCRRRIRRRLRRDNADPRQLPDSCWNPGSAAEIFCSTCRSTFRARRWSNCASTPAHSTSIPASSRGRAGTPTPTCRRRRARTMRCARARWRCAAAFRRVRPPS